ncbi:unnamed protein product [Peniophora sp. CBMAI 1063]|nr:unnamed protein product [Peniophora sp. CBMAI 1063]
MASEYRALASSLRSWTRRIFRPQHPVLKPIKDSIWCCLAHLDDYFYTLYTYNHLVCHVWVCCCGDWAASEV